jgi:hypothetical protein
MEHNYQLTNAYTDTQSRRRQETRHVNITMVRLLGILAARVAVVAVMV